VAQRFFIYNALRSFAFFAVRYTLFMKHIVIVVLLMLQSNPAAPRSSENLPELDAFLRGVREHLRSDRLLQIQYTYNLKETETQLDKKGNPKKIEVKEYEVYPSLDEEFNYMRLISKNGSPLDPEKIEKQDREHDKKMREQARDLEKEGTDEHTRRLQREAKEKHKEDEIIDELFRLYDIKMAGREMLDGRSAIQLTFQPFPNAKPSLKEGKILVKVAGRVWFCEEDHQLMRLEADLIDNISFGLGLLARLNKGAKAIFVRRRVNDEVWLPAEAHFSGTARVLLLKGIRIKTDSEYSNYKKFTVDASVKFGGNSK
jgi:hypothetical protein